MVPKAHNPSAFAAPSVHLRQKQRPCMAAGRSEGRWAKGLPPQLLRLASSWLKRDGILNQKDPKKSGIKCDLKKNIVDYYPSNNVCLKEMLGTQPEKNYRVTRDSANINGDRTETWSIFGWLIYVIIFLYLVATSPQKPILSQQKSTKVKGDSRSNISGPQFEPPWDNPIPNSSDRRRMIVALRQWDSAQADTSNHGSGVTHGSPNLLSDY